MKASDVMSRNVVSIERSAAVSEAIGLMLDKQISGLPVLDEAGKVVGILTEGDLLRRSETGTERHRPRWLEILMGPGRMAGVPPRSRPSAPSPWGNSRPAWRLRISRTRHQATPGA